MSLLGISFTKSETGRVCGVWEQPWALFTCAMITCAREWGGRSS